MKILIDNEEKNIEFSKEDLESIKSVLQKMEKLILKEGKVFTKIEVDGEELTEKNRDRILTLNPGDVDKVSFVTANPRKLSIEALEELLRYLPKLEEGANTVAELLSVGEYEKAYNLFAKVIDGINWFIKLLKTLPPVTGMNYNEIVYNGKNVASAFGEFERVMNILLKAFEDRDDVIIAKILKEDVSPVLRKWTEITKILKDYMEKPIN